MCDAALLSVMQASVRAGACVPDCQLAHAYSHALSSQVNQAPRLPCVLAQGVYAWLSGAVGCGDQVSMGLL